MWGVEGVTSATLEAKPYSRSTLEAQGNGVHALQATKAPKPKIDRHRHKNPKHPHSLEKLLWELPHRRLWHLQGLLLVHGKQACNIASSISLPLRSNAVLLASSTTVSKLHRGVQRPLLLEQPVQAHFVGMVNGGPTLDWGCALAPPHFLKSTNKFSFKLKIVNKILYFYILFHLYLYSWTHSIYFL